MQSIFLICKNKTPKSDYHFAGIGHIFSVKAVILQRLRNKTLTTTNLLLLTTNYYNTIKSKLPQP